MSAITDWLTKIGACAPSIDVFSGTASIPAAYAAITRPDWLLWFCFSQSTDTREKKRVLGIVHGLMAQTISAAVASTTVAAPVNNAVNAVASFLQGAGPDAGVIREYQVSLLGAAAPSPLAQAAIACARSMLHLCETSPGPLSGIASSDLALQWLSLRRALGTLPTGSQGVTTLTNELRTAIPLNDMTGLQ